MERETGIEPATSSLGSWRSTAELLPLTGANELRLSPGGPYHNGSTCPLGRCGNGTPWFREGELGSSQDCGRRGKGETREEYVRTPVRGGALGRRFQTRIRRCVRN